MSRDITDICRALVGHLSYVSCKSSRADDALIDNHCTNRIRIDQMNDP